MGAVPYLSMSTKKNTTTILTFGIIFCLSTVFFILHWPVIKCVTVDDGNHYYLAKRIFTGDILYRDLFSDKPPLTEYIGAFCFFIGRGKILPSIILTRFVFFSFFMLSAIPLFFTSRYILKKPNLAYFVVLLYLSFNFPYKRIASGAEWHTLMNFFGLLAIAFFLKDYYILSGLCSSLATLSWMPGVIFFIATFSSIILFYNVKKKGKLLKISFSFAFSIFLLLMHLYVNGSLQDFIKQALLFGEFVVKGGFLEGLTLIPRAIYTNYKFNIPVIVLAAIGFVISSVQIAKGCYKDINLKACFLPASILLMIIIFSIVEFEQAPDFIPFLPWISFYAVYFINFLLYKIKNPLAIKIVSMCFILALIVFSLKNTIEKPPSLTLKKQNAAVLSMLKSFDMRNDDLLFCMHAAYPLLFMNKKNITKHLRFFENRHYMFIERYEKNGFDSIVYSVSEMKPKLVCIHKNCMNKFLNKYRYQKLRKLLEADYEKFENGNLIIYARK